MPKSVAELVVDAVLHDLRDRRGVGQELKWVEANAEETYAEMVAMLTGIVQDILEHEGCNP